MLNVALLTGFLATTISLAAPIIIAAEGELIVEKSGIINVSIEGMMLTGAFTAFVATSLTQNPVIGLIAAAGAGIILAFIFGLLAIKFLADQVVIGTALNIFALGVTGVLFHALRDSLPVIQSDASFAAISIPLLCKLPFIGKALFDQDVLVYAAFLIAPLLHVFLMRTRLGLGLRATGEYPLASDSAGFRVESMRLCAILFGGALAGMAGAYLSVAYTTGFAQGMSGGMGFIALAVVIVGRWSASGIVLGALLFGAASALQFGFQASNTHTPYQLFLALPYLMTLGALTLRSGRVSAPLSLGTIFKRG